MQTYPGGTGSCRPAPSGRDVVEWINVNYFDTLEAVKNALLLNVLIPFKRFLLDLPWPASWPARPCRAGVSAGWRLALLAAGLAFLIAATGQWEKAMITVYLCGISVIFASLIGIPIGIIVGATTTGCGAGVQLAIDTLQTLPSFVYLMPVVMLFRVGDFTAMIAVVAYAVVPAIRYTVLGIQRVDPRLVEAGRAMGCTEWQILTRIKLKLALPEIMLGHEPDDHVRAVDAGHHRAGRHPRPRPGGLYRADQGRHRARPRRRPRRRLHRHHRRPADSAPGAARAPARLGLAEEGGMTGDWIASPRCRAGPARSTSSR